MKQTNAAGTRIVQGGGGVPSVPSFYGVLASLAAPAAFAAMLRRLFRSDWVVYAKRPFGGAELALRYLGCYTHRVAISNHRLGTLGTGTLGTVQSLSWMSPVSLHVPARINARVR